MPKTAEKVDLIFLNYQSDLILYNGEKKSKRVSAVYLAAGYH